MSIGENYKEQYQNIVLGEMLREFYQYTNISVPSIVLECLMNSSQLTASPFNNLPVKCYVGNNVVKIGF